MTDTTITAPENNEPIGTVDNATGPVELIRADGVTVRADAGTPVFQGDTITTLGGARVGIVFVDDSTFSLGENGSLAVDEMIFDPGTQEGSSAFNVMQGVFTFVSGQIAKTAPDAMTVSTPVMTIGIRGTTVAGKAGAEGEENTITLLEDASGHTGEIVVRTEAGLVVMNNAFQQTTMTSALQAPKSPVTVDRATVERDYGDARQALPAPKVDQATEDDNAAMDGVTEDGALEERATAADTVEGEEAETGLEPAQLADLVAAEAAKMAAAELELIPDFDGKLLDPNWTGEESLTLNLGDLADANLIAGTDSLFSTASSIARFGFAEPDYAFFASTDGNLVKESEKTTSTATDENAKKDSSDAIVAPSPSLGDDLLYGSSGDDTFDMVALSTLGGQDTLYGGSGTDKVRFGDLADFQGLYDAASESFAYVSAGTSGSVELHGIEGFDASSGGDSLSITFDANEIGRGYLLAGTSANDTLTAADGTPLSPLGETVSGTLIGAILFGGDGNDSLTGSSGGDHLLGGNGDDWIVGGADADELTGGAGADTFVYTGTGDYGDSLLDFESGIDSILFDLSDYGADGFLTVDGGGTAAFVTAGDGIQVQTFDLTSGGTMAAGTNVWNLGNAGSIADVQTLLQTNVIQISNAATTGHILATFNDGSQDRLLDIAIANDTDTSAATVSEIAGLNGSFSLDPGTDLGFVA
ncbi:MAG: FecR domain-containing protein [Rhodospirillales bacterium]